jgi:hypothetical protein
LTDIPTADVSLPFCPACATDIANSESKAEVITAIAALRMFNILILLDAPCRDRAAVSIFGDFCKGDWIRARFIPAPRNFLR